MKTKKKLGITVWILAGLLLGFSYTTMDLTGYRTGSMNEVL